jgi:putative ABC transport system ATP-binding protein
LPKNDEEDLMRDSPREEGGGVPVALEGVSKRYRTGADSTITALDGITLSVEPGEVVGFSGPSGSGKSTLLHVVGAMDVADEGVIRCGEDVVTSLSSSEQVQYRRKIGFVFQRFHLLPALNVLDNVIAPVIPYRTSFDKYDKARELLEAVGLADRGESLPSRLSGGQQQRVAIARALVNDPRLLLADEPTGNVDSHTGSEIMDLLLDLRAERSMTVLVATHDPIVAARCDRIVTLEDGRATDDVRVADRHASAEVFARISRLDPRA